MMQSAAKGAVGSSSAQKPSGVRMGHCSRMLNLGTDREQLPCTPIV